MTVAGLRGGPGRLCRWRRAGVAAAALVLAAVGASAGSLEALPWHLVDYTYDFDPVGAFQSLDIDIDISGDTAPGHYLYVSPIWGKIGGAGFYFGLQTDVSGHGGGDRGAGVIFSRWGAATTADARPAARGWAEALDDGHSGEGDFVGVRLPYAWGPGSYHFRLGTLAAAGGGCWVDLEVRKRGAGEAVDAGSLRFRSCDTFYPNPVSFIEIYALPPGTAPDRARLPHTAIRIHPPVVNGFRLPLRASPHIPRGVPPLAAMTRDSDGLRAVLSAD